ncbi:hypothetical protein KFK14_17760 [Sphingobium phenoxybenzoativorans]|uniref:Uncharacterized protein n=1 Tax=Sphingobium phenoxybenzoativorans TaxID=1592790 RepID=A0A975Q0Y4_9SPHN|nr:hypothetical protein [Sphingobium phenoxybenzoativorans]QUT04858.1 hypothetical protein KFK14_17760 [Sphingobium phenoxybenzoativorans]
MAKNPATVLMGYVRQAFPNREIIPEHFAAAYGQADGRGDLATIWLEGWRAGIIEGEESLSVFNPYADDTEIALYEAWQAGFDAAGWSGAMQLVPEPPLIITASEAELRALRSAHGGRSTEEGTDLHAMFEAMAKKGWVKEVTLTGDGIAWKLTRDGIMLAHGQ